MTTGNRSLRFKQENSACPSLPPTPAPTFDHSRRDLHRPRRAEPRRPRERRLARSPCSPARRPMSTASAARRCSSPISGAARVSIGGVESDFAAGSAVIVPADTDFALFNPGDRAVRGRRGPAGRRQGGASRRRAVHARPGRSEASRRRRHASRLHQGLDMGGDRVGESLEVIAALEQADDPAAGNDGRRAASARRVAQAKSSSLRLSEASGSRQWASNPAEMTIRSGAKRVDRRQDPRLERLHELDAAGARRQAAR